MDIINDYFFIRHKKPYILFIYLLFVDWKDSELILIAWQWTHDFLG